MNKGLPHKPIHQCSGHTFKALHIGTQHGKTAKRSDPVYLTPGKEQDHLTTPPDRPTNNKPATTNSQPANQLPTNRKQAKQPTDSPTDNKPATNDQPAATNSKPAKQPINSPTDRPSQQPTNFKPAKQPTHRPTDQQTKQPSNWQPSTRSVFAPSRSRSAGFGSRFSLSPGPI